MQTRNLLAIKNELIYSMQRLRISIDEATAKMSETYHEDHHIVQRLKSYYPALDKQEEYVNMLDALILENNYEEIELLSTKIRAIADMIKTDARSLLLSLQTGEEEFPEGVVWN